MDTQNNVDLSFVIPCLNEEETIGGVIDEINDALDGSGIKYEIIVSDNGSTDKSKDISLSKGCRVVEERIHKGYGAALQKGFGAAQGEYVAFSDADGSYIVSHIKDMYKTAKEKNCDMVIASRLKGEIEESAMPFLHRYLGTPVLTFLINIFFNGRLSDCNSGFRLIRKEAYEKWNIKGMGMEFASELLVKALKNKASIIEIPSGLRRDKRSRSPHLKTWRDGMRHLLFILSESAHIFEYVAYIFVLLSLFLLSFTPHLTISLLLMIGGFESFFISIFLYRTHGNGKLNTLTRILVNLKEDTLFFFLAAMLFMLIITGILIVGFPDMGAIFAPIAVAPLLTGSNLLLIYMSKKADD